MQFNSFLLLSVLSQLTSAQNYGGLEGQNNDGTTSPAVAAATGKATVVTTAQATATVPATTSVTTTPAAPSTNKGTTTLAGESTTKGTTTLAGESTTVWWTPSVSVWWTQLTTTYVSGSQTYTEVQTTQLLNSQVKSASVPGSTTVTSESAKSTSAKVTTAESKVTSTVHFSSGSVISDYTTVYTSASTYTISSSNSTANFAGNLDAGFVAKYYAPLAVGGVAAALLI